jgi:phospholipase/carboxylesterase
MNLQYRLRPAAGEPEGALVLFHGRGADENDLHPLLDFLDPERRLVAATPRGPLSLPPGGAHWYIVREIGFPDRETFDASYRLAGDWLAAFAEETGVPPERTVLGGFSQGAVMTYALGLGRAASLAMPPKRPRDSFARPLNEVQPAPPSHDAVADRPSRPQPAALIALSGFIPTVEGFELDLAQPLPRVAIGHGTYDPVISVEWSRRARAELEGASAEVLYREYPLPHAVDPRYLSELSSWLADIFVRSSMRASTAE